MIFISFWIHFFSITIPTDSISGTLINFLLSVHWFQKLIMNPSLAQLFLSVKPFSGPKRCGIPRNAERTQECWTLSHDFFKLKPFFPAMIKQEISKERLSGSELMSDNKKHCRLLKKCKWKNYLCSPRIKTLTSSNNNSIVSVVESVIG